MISRADYLELERDGSVRHEWVAGQIYAMTGESGRHNRISGRLYASLLAAAERDGCRPYIADMKVVTETRGYYPDVMVVCNAAVPGDHHEEAPCLIAEVLSPSTQDRDRREKRAAYQAMPSLRHLLLIRQDDTQLEHFFREDDGSWNMLQLGPDDVIVLHCPEVTVPVDDLYRGLELGV